MKRPQDLLSLQRSLRQRISGAGSEGVLSSVEEILLQYPELLLSQDEDQRTPLHLACHYGSPVEVILFLVQQCPQATRMLDKWNQTPLALACQNPTCLASLQVIQALADAFPAALGMADALEQYTPLHWACRGGASLPVLQYLARKDPGACLLPDKQGKLPLDLAKENKAFKRH